MMKRDRLLPLLILFLILICARAAPAQEKESATQTTTYQMQLVWVVDGSEGDRREFMFVVGSLGFKTVDGLKNFVALLPAGSRLEWSPGCLRMGNEPLLSSTEELEDFQRFCAEHNVEFILHPSG